MRSIALKATAFTALVAITAFVPVSAQASNSKLAINNSSSTLLGKKIAQADTDSTKAEATKTAVKTEVKVTVAEGDSLSSIAEKHQTTWVRLYNANEGVTDPNVINPGQVLRVPSADEQLAERALPVVAAPVATYSASAQSYSTARAVSRPAASYPVDANGAKAFIYSRESGNNPNATNPGGCYGIGQDCNGVVRGTCGADYACQDQYFTNYAMRRYGSWENAQAFWNANHWW